MGVITKWTQGRKERRAKKRAERPGGGSDRALKRQAAKAQRLQHERLDDKLPR
jgi:hypothetical protein